MKEKDKIFCVPSEILNLINLNDSSFITPEMKESFLNDCKQKGSFIIRKDLDEKNQQVIPYVIIYSSNGILIHDSVIGFEMDLLENTWNGNFLFYFYNTINQFIDQNIEIRGKFKFEDIAFLKRNKAIYWVTGINVQCEKEEFARLKNGNATIATEGIDEISQILIKNGVLTKLGFLPKEKTLPPEEKVLNLPLLGEPRTIAILDEFANFPEDKRLEKLIPVKKEPEVEKTEEKLKTGKRKRKVRTKVSKPVSNKED